MKPGILSFPVRYLCLLVAVGITLASCHKDTPARTAPVISSFTPASGSEGATVEITGTNFSDVATEDTVRFNGVTAVVIAATPTKLTVKVPEGGTTGKISVTIESRSATSASDFTVVPLAPVVTGFTPAQGIAGTVVEITGMHFAAGSEVYFGAVKAQEVTVVSPVKITAKVPAEAVTGSIKVKVTSLESISGTSFTVVPQAVSFAPDHGEAGSELTLTGTGFAATATVTVNGKAVSNWEYVSREAGKIVCKIPAGASAGKIVLKQNNIDYEFAGTYKVTNTWALINFGHAATYGNSISFVYNSKWYIGLGKGANAAPTTNFKIYDPVTNNWTDGPVYPAGIAGKNDAQAIVFNNKVYIGNAFGQKDWWEYDPAVTGDAAARQMTSYPVAGYGSFSFVNNGKIYVGQGTGNANVYEFDVTGSNGMGDWKPKVVLNVTRVFGMAFAINGVAYWGGGEDATGQVLRTVGKYNITDNGYTGSAAAPVPGTDALWGEAFVYQDKGYVLTRWGRFYEYTPGTDTWVTKGSILPEGMAGSYHAAVFGNRILAADYNGKVFEYIPNY